MPGAQKQPRGPFNPHDVAPPLAVRDGPWKLLAKPDGSDAQLYNLDSDPGEANDLTDKQPRIRKRLLAKLLAWSGRLHP
jgi:hypothetical protein